MKINQVVMQKTILAILLAGLSILTTAQSDYEITYPYNPDADSDGFISTPDLLEFLGFYGYPFMLGEIYVDGESLGDVMVNLQALFESNFEAGNENGDFLRWDSALETWVPHSILSEVQIEDVDFLDDVVVMTGAQISNDLGVGGALGAQSLIVQGTINANGTINGRDLAADGLKLDGIENGAQVNVQADWTASSGAAAILNKPPTITTEQSSKLEGIETGAQQTNAERVDDAGAVMTTDNYIRILSDLGKEIDPSEEIISKYNFEEPDNYPMVIQGGDHGLLIAIQDKPWDKDWDDYLDGNGAPREFKQQAPSSAHKFISFASGRPYDGPGNHVKNDKVTFIGSIKGNGPDNYNDLAAGVLLFPYSMYVHLANMMAAANSGGEYVQSCAHTFEFKNNHGSSISYNTNNGQLSVDNPGTYMWVGVERAQRFTFPGEYHFDYYISDEEQNEQAAASAAGDPPLAPEFEGFILGNSEGILDENGMAIVNTISDAGYEDLVDRNGNCRSADCWGWIKMFPRDEPYEIIIPEIHDVKLRFVTDQGLTANPNYVGDNIFSPDDPANDNTIRWTNPYVEIQVGADLVLMNNEANPLEEFYGYAGGSMWEYAGSWCPSPVDDVDSGDGDNSSAGTTQTEATTNNYNGQITSYYTTTQPNPEHAEMYAYITQVLSVIDALRNGIMLMTAVIPPGLPFDAVDIPDMLISFLLSLGNMVVTFGEAESTYGVTYGSGGADYAEYLPKYDPSEMFAYGEIVGVLNGQISKRFIEADHYMVVSKAPMILGNDPGDPEAEADFEKVAFMGQVPVKVKGDVESGDFILMTNQQDGIGIGVSPDAISLAQREYIVGVAWQSTVKGVDVDFQYVNTAIGLSNNDFSKEIVELQSQIAELHKGFEFLTEFFVSQGGDSQALIDFTSAIESLASNETSFSKAETRNESSSSDAGESTAGRGASENEVRNETTISSGNGNAVVGSSTGSSVQSKFKDVMTNSAYVHGGNKAMNAYLDFIKDMPEFNAENRKKLAYHLNEIAKSQIGVDMTTQYPLIMRMIEDPVVMGQVQQAFETDLAALTYLLNENSKKENSSEEVKR